MARQGRLVCIDSSEYGIYQLEQELRESHPQMEGVYYTANVREFSRVPNLSWENWEA